jgi:hypothetical protein
LPYNIDFIDVLVNFGMTPPAVIRQRQLEDGQQGA